MLVAAVVILAGVVVVASGRGGEMAVTAPDYPPIDLGPVTSADVALLRPPSAAWGYNMRVTDEALEVIAKAVTERDVEIAALQQEVSDLRDQLGGGGRTATLEPAGDGGGAERTEPETPLPPAPEMPEPAWPSDEEATAAGTAVPVTRPQPIYHEDPDPSGPSDSSEQNEQSGPSADSDYGGQSGLSDQGEPPAGLSAPWEPAPPPGEAPLWEPPHSPTAEHAISWEAPEPAADEQPHRQPTSGWSADPADTSPDATALDWNAAAPHEEPAGPAAPAPAAPAGAPDPDGQTSVPVTPATGWRAPTGSVWEVASRQVDQDQAKPADARDSHEFNWDKDPHQRLVWGAANARAKSAKASEETLPNGERHEDDRG
jgi:hypothetical protein